MIRNSWGVTRSQHQGVGRRALTADLVAPGFGAASHRPGIRGRVASPRDSGPRRIALLLDVTAEELGHDGVLLGRGEQPGRGVAAQQCRPAEDAVGVGVERPREGLTDGPGDPAGDPGAQLGGGLAAEGQDEDLLGINSGVDPGGDGLDDRRRLAGAGTGQDEQRAGLVIDDGLLGGVQLRSRATGGRAGGAGRRGASPATSRYTGAPAWCAVRSATDVLPRTVTRRWKHGEPTVRGTRSRRSVLAGPES